MYGALEAFARIAALEPAPCAAEGDALCEVVLDLTGNASLARAADWLVARPLRIVLIVVLALLLRYAVHRVVDRAVKRLAAGRSVGGRLPEGRARQVVEGASPLGTERLRQRSEAMGSVLKSVSSFAIVVVAGMMALSELGLDLAPLIASAGIAGVALGFGAQNLVKDFLAGVFMIFEDQYGVGDVIDTGQAAGTVQAVGLRVTQLRDAEGVVWYVRNGEVLRVGNESQGWSNAVVRVVVGPETDVAAVEVLLVEVADRLRREPAWSDLVTGAPLVSIATAPTTEPVDASGQALEVALRARPSAHEELAAELDTRVRQELSAHGVDLITEPAAS